MGWEVSLLGGLTACEVSFQTVTVHLQTKDAWAGLTLEPATRLPSGVFRENLMRASETLAQRMHGSRCSDALSRLLLLGKQAWWGYATLPL